VSGVEQKMTISDDAFAKIVAEEVKNKASQSNRSILLEKENWGRWSRALRALIDNLDQQLDDIESDIAADTERYGQIDEGDFLLATSLAVYETRKKKIQRFKFHVENRLVQVDGMIHTGVALKDEPVANLMHLQNAIRTHKRLMYEFDMEDTALDRALWASLDGKWLFDKITEEDLQ
jgi:hypothetical protein